jgi:hypothetical protein
LLLIKLEKIVFALSLNDKIKTKVVRPCHTVVAQQLKKYIVGLVTMGALTRVTVMVGQKLIIQN